MVMVSYGLSTAVVSFYSWLFFMRWSPGRRHGIERVSMDGDVSTKQTIVERSLYDTGPFGLTIGRF